MPVYEAEKGRKYQLCVANGLFRRAHSQQSKAHTRESPRPDIRHFRYIVIPSMYAACREVSGLPISNRIRLEASALQPDERALPPTQASPHSSTQCSNNSTCAAAIRIFTPYSYMHHFGHTTLQTRSTTNTQTHTHTSAPPLLRRLGSSRRHAAGDTCRHWPCSVLS